MSSTTVKNTEKNGFGNAGTMAAETKDDLRDVAYEAGRKAKHYLTEACDNVSHTTENVTAEIRRNPVQSSMVALGLGFVLGALFRR